MSTPGVLAERSSSVALAPGCPWPLGACIDRGGVNFAVYSAHAEAIELCLFDA